MSLACGSLRKQPSQCCRPASPSQSGEGQCFPCSSQFLSQHGLGDARLSPLSVLSSWTRFCKLKLLWEMQCLVGMQLFKLVPIMSLPLNAMKTGIVHGGAEQTLLFSNYAINAWSHFSGWGVEGKFWFLDGCRGLYDEMHTDIFTATGNENSEQYWASVMLRASYKSPTHLVRLKKTLWLNSQTFCNWNALQLTAPSGTGQEKAFKTQEGFGVGFFWVWFLFFWVFFVGFFPALPLNLRGSQSFSKLF